MLLPLLSSVQILVRLESREEKRVKTNSVYNEESYLHRQYTCIDGEGDGGSFYWSTKHNVFLQIFMSQKKKSRTKKKNLRIKNRSPYLDKKCVILKRNHEILQHNFMRPTQHDFFENCAPFCTLKIE